MLRDKELTVAGGRIAGMLSWIGATPIRTTWLAGSILAATITAAPAHAAMLGQQVGYQYIVETNVTHDPGPLLVGPGVELNAIFSPVDAGSVDIGDDFILLSFAGRQGGFLPNAGYFNGFRLFDVLSTLPDITAASIDASTNMPGLTAAAITFDADNLYVDLAGRTFTETTIVRVNLTFAGSTDPGPVTVPEPATLMLLGVGLMGLGLVRRVRSA